jgi:curved DNA-binding protein CbpA
MKDYYEIMKVDRKATEAEIKRAFRQLANQYHPDKNPSVEAEAIFKEINEAYEVLSDPASRLDYDQRLASPAFFNYQYIRPQKTTYRGPSERALFQNSLLRYTRVLFVFGCMWCSLLIVDYTMPADHLQGKVTSDALKPNRLSIHRSSTRLTTSLGPAFGLGDAELKYFPYETDVHIYRSPLLSAIIRVENYNSTFVINNLGSIYRNFLFAPILLCALCVLGLVIKSGAEFHVNLGIVVFLVMILNIVLLFSSRI